MLIREAKLAGTPEQFAQLDAAIRTAQCVRNRCLRYWRDNAGVSKNDLQKFCAVLAKDAEQPWMGLLNSQARQAAAERTWQSIQSFYRRCKEGAKHKGYPKFKKHSRSVEYKTSGWKLSDDGMSITFTDGFKAGQLELWLDGSARQLILSSKINRVRVVRRADGYYAQFCLDVERQEAEVYSGNVIGLDLGLKYFTKDSNGAEVACPKFFRKGEKRLRRAQRRLSKRFKKGAKPQSKNYHKQRQRLGSIHLKIQRQRKDWAIKQARCVMVSNDIVVYEDLRVANLVRSRHLAKSIHDAGWTQFTHWLDYYGKLWSKVVVAVNPAYTSQDCSGCGYRVQKSLSTRTHDCPHCGLTICRDQNAALNILKRGLEVVGAEWNNGTAGHAETASFEETTGEISTSAEVGQPTSVSAVAEPVRTSREAV
ncbi:RNA-guided endonuclease InsQ/TnpB family protein [Synechococcus elongatus]|uniref:RNA-guided endonuclease InsQ/TnpB family protein n=1 Tax=Synechococcus elongatus TaxID=32046 RepID=UPI000F7F49A4|nr:RNA-guided endonuclease TnpB family protein [Synechococcus elongatus]